MAVKSKIKLWIDTDIGDDVDDALAIALAVRSPDLELLGVSTVYRNTGERARLASKLLDLLNTKAPVAAGVGLPLRKPADLREIPRQCCVLEACEPLEPQDGLEAVIRMIDAARENPDMVLLGIGPLTNLALAIRLAPSVMRPIRVVLMGGAFSAAYPEYNILCDPEAANIVLTSGQQIEMVGLDVTVPCVLPAEDLQIIAESKDTAGKFLAALVDVWMKTSKGKKVTLHDPLTVAYLIDPSLLEMVPAPVRVELGGSVTHGLTAVLRTPFRQRGNPVPDNVKIAVNVNPDRVRRLVMEQVFQNHQ